MVKVGNEVKTKQNLNWFEQDKKREKNSKKEVEQIDTKK